MTQAQEIINNGKFYVGILDNEDGSGIGVDYNFKKYAYIKALNLDRNNLMDTDISTIRMFAVDYPEKNRKIFTNMSTNELSQELSDKVFIFNIVRTKTNNNNYYQYKAINIVVRKKPSMLDNNDKLIGVPYFENKEKLEETIKKHTEISFNFLSTISSENPIIMSGDDINNISIYYDLPFEVSTKGISFNKDNDEYAEISVYKAISEKINSNISFSTLINEERVAFIPENIISMDGLNKISEDVSYLDWSNFNSQEEIDDSKDTKKNNVAEKVQVSEIDFIKHFINLVENKYGLTFSYPDLINFHNSVKSNLLTILAGLSGTGKSKITEIYADSLGILNDQQYKMISVRPFWQDDTDLLGFVDNKSNNYHSGDTELVETLIQANKHKDKMYLIVFDEMNIARIEHYFSQFISVLERSPQERQLILYNPKLEPRLYNSDRYPSKILIPENVRFVGTMNLDESTFQISNRFLDRANVIDFEILPFSKRKRKNKSQLIHDLPIVSFIDFKTFYNNSNDLNNRELIFFEKLHEIINRTLPGTGLSWRTLNNIELFIKNAPNLNIFNRKLALDLQVSGRILPKVRGTEEMINNLVSINDKNSIESLLNEFNDLSDFEKSKTILKQKRQELNINGFAR